MARTDVARINALREPVGDAYERARRLVDELADNGDPQTGQAMMVFERLKTIQLQLVAYDTPPEVAMIGATLGDLADECEGSLSELRPLLERAAAVATE